MSFDISLFLGRFHPLLVHLPIGFIIIALVMEFIPNRNSRTQRIVWFLCFLASLFSIISGLQLSSASSYPDALLGRHKWIGIAICILSFLFWALHGNILSGRKKLGTVLKWALFLLLIMGGHFGGQLTHGNSYLIDAAPESIKGLFGAETAESIDLSKIHTDSIYTYEHLLDPIIQSKCSQCHNSKNKSGDLNLITIDSMFLGGTNGDVVVAGNPNESEIFHRVTLDQNNKKFMPTKGTPLNYNEMKLLSWWIENGANAQEVTSLTLPSDEMITLIMDEYNIDLSPRPWYEKEEGPEIDSVVIQKLEASGYKTSRISANNNFLELTFNEGTTDAELPFDIDENVIILNAKNVDLPEEFYGEISKLKNLIRIQLNGTKTTTDQLLMIKNLNRLESINLYGTQIDNEGLMYLANFPNLKRVYTWQSGVTEEGILSFNEQRPDIKIYKGL